MAYKNDWSHLHAAGLPSFPETVDVLLETVDVRVLGLVLPGLLDSRSDSLNILLQLVNQRLQRKAKRFPEYQPPGK